MNKVLMIGIDGLDPILLSKLENKLPNFKKLREEGISIKLESIYPYDSIPIWSSIYTGLTPARHGLLKPINYLKEDDVDINTNILSGRTFWDFASSAGKKVCIINPFVAYPPWQVNGVMVSGPLGKEGVPQAFPQTILDTYKIPHLGGIHGKYPLKKDLTKFRERAEKITLDETDFALKILKDYEWDLAFTCFITLDGVEHFFWRYYDDEDPTHPDNNPFENVIIDFYKLFDKIVGKFTALDYDTILIFSDHGFGMRSVKLVNINEILREKRFLVSKAKNQNNPVNMFEKVKSKLLDFIYKHDLDDLALELSRFVPTVSKKIQKSSFSIDFKQSMAYTSDLVGMNPCGGINIVAENMGKLNYEEVRTLILKEISELKDPDTGKRLMKWLCRREELYSGEYISDYPDIIFELEDGYGVNWSIHTPLISNCYAHKIISGGHKRDATFMIEGVGEDKIVRSDMTSVDIAPTVLDLLDIKGYFNFDGHSLFVE
ncbi:MAG: Type I phosphodiesterase / nucleotide pyrophosphatase [Candidatus Argoarchaeum ethanivorans]|uniref:Type I phosphodiesterase / nucleotide pyrophosphatase n=1 Tax=Candidatus Argoarchaeum ethanivorans TaxID=2608793 RepID=A0A811T726_9EURY|nr:MAG: Type I phosphodiesterase / nucleotide pyrophosphatase [Candidatus Argoarchaeum ethanivorans]